MSYYSPQPSPYPVGPPNGQVQSYTVQPAPTFDANSAYAAAAGQVQFQAPAPQAFASAPQQFPSYNRDELRTIFVTGFPQDVKERELTNMCRFMPGYEAASMKASAHGVQQGFVLFMFGHQAHQALSLMNGIDFGDGFKLRAEMARKNMYVRAGQDVERPSKMFRGDNGAVSGQVVGGADRTSDNPPCDTLFIGNLSLNITEADVEAYFRNIMGDRFTASKLSRSGNNRVSAFVQFIDIPTAQEVHASQQGKEMPGSDRGPMRIQFSKNALGEFGKRRREEAGGGLQYGGAVMDNGAAANSFAYAQVEVQGTGGGVPPDGGGIPISAMNYGGQTQ